MILYTYFRSSAAYRVRIALHHKRIPHENKFVHLLKGGGEQFTADFARLNPSQEVPVIVHNGRSLSQSMAIIQYLENVNPALPLFPQDPFDRAQVVRLCEMVNSGIHPVQNLKVLKELETRFGLDTAGKQAWAKFWIERGLASLEKALESCAGTYSFGGEFSAADAFLVPQVFGAKRYQVDLIQFPIVKRVYERCLQLPAVRTAHPAHQPDTPQGEYTSIE
jgi:maleylacetoacetate isomerase